MAAIHCLSCNRVSECNLTMTSPLRSRSSLLICLCYPTWQSPHKPQNTQSCFQSVQLQRTLHFKIFKGWWAGFVIAPQCVSVLLILTVEIVHWAKGEDISGDYIKQQQTNKNPRIMVLECFKALPNDLRS